jgi:hypothetical protein
MNCWLSITVFCAAPAASSPLTVGLFDGAALGGLQSWFGQDSARNPMNKPQKLSSNGLLLLVDQ